MLENLNSPADLEGARLGPVDVAITADRIAFYAETTGDDPARWVDEAPPGFGSVLLFAVADLFLYHPRVVPFTATLLHLDQSFTYLAPMAANSIARVSGTITRVRERAGSFFVTFEASGTADGTELIRSVSTFVLSDQAAPAPEVVNDEPAARDRAAVDATRKSASRHDLVRYAAATRDFNPLHWDHETAVEAGLPGMVVHGLLMYAWMVQHAESVSGRKVNEAKVRFRSALHPAEQAILAAEIEGQTVKVTLSRGDMPLVTGSATVAPDPE